MLVVDLDDTLLNDERIISDVNAEAIKAIKNEGIHIVFCSGRSDESMNKYIKSLSIHKDEDYFISFNGAKIQQVSGETIFYEAIEKPILNSLIEVGKEYSVSTQLYVGNKLVVENYTEEIETYEMMTGLKATVIENMEQVNKSTKILYNCKDIDVLNDIKKKLELLYSDDINVFFSKPTYLEVLNKKASKGLAVKYLANYLNVNRDEIVAIGDSYNDLSMIQYAGKGVVVKNGREGVKSQADYITKATNNEHAVAEVIKKYF
jgi:Cof subfamily protein (haloacid dehalogenase superfamily)